MGKNEILWQTEFIETSFKEYFKKLGYVQVKEKDITSRVDKSVYFIGSAISTLKPYFLEEKIPKEGIFSVQRAIRTQGLKNIYDDSIAEWSSYFKAMGVLVNYESLDKLCKDIWGYFHNILKIDKDDMKIRAFSRDSDLINAWKSVIDAPQIEYDTKEESYYRHKYGLKDIRNIW